MLVEEGERARAQGQWWFQGGGRPFESAPAAYRSHTTRREDRSKRNHHRSRKHVARPQSGRRSYQSMPPQISTKEKKLGSDQKQDNKVSDAGSDVERGDTSNVKKGASMGMNSVDTFRAFVLGSDCKYRQGYRREDENTGEEKILKDEDFHKHRKDRKSLPMKDASMDEDHEKTDLDKLNRKPAKLTKDDANKQLQCSEKTYPVDPDQNLKYQKLKKLVSEEENLPEKVDGDKKVAEECGISTADGVAPSRMTAAEIQALRQGISNAQLRERERELEKQRQKRAEIDALLRRQDMTEKEKLRVNLEGGIQLRGELDCCATCEDKEVGLMALDNRVVEESDLTRDEETTLKKCVDPLQGDGKEKASREEKEGKEKEREEEEKDMDCCILEACQEDFTVIDPLMEETQYRSVDEMDEDQLVDNNYVNGELNTMEAMEHSCDFTDISLPSSDQDESCKSGLYTFDWTDDNRGSVTENAPDACSTKSMQSVGDVGDEEEKDDEYDSAGEKDTTFKGTFDIEEMVEGLCIYVKARMKQAVDNKMKEGIKSQLTEMIHTMCQDVELKSEDGNEIDEKSQVSVEEEKANQEEKGLDAHEEEEPDCLEEGQDDTEAGPNHTETESDHIKEKANEIEDECDEDVNDEEKDTGDEKSLSVEKHDLKNGSKENKEINAKRKKSRARGKSKGTGRESKKAMKKCGKARDVLEEWAEKMERYIKQDEEITVEFLEPQNPKPSVGVPKARGSIKERRQGDDEGMQQGAGHTTILLKVTHCRDCRKGQARVRKKGLGGIPKLCDNQRRLKLLEGSRRGRRCSEFGGNSHGGYTGDGGGGTDGGEAGSHRGRKDGGGEQNNNNNLPGGGGPGNHGNGGSGSGGGGDGTQPTRDPVSAAVPEYDPKRFRKKKHWDDSELDWAEFLGDLMKKVMDRGGPLWELDDSRVLFCVTQCLTRLEDITEDMILCNACNTINSLLKHYANCVTLYNDCIMCVQIFSLICVHIHSCITNDTAIYCEVKLCSNIALKYEGTDLSMNLKMLWFLCRKKLARIIGSDEQGLSDIPEDAPIPAGKPPSSKRSSRVLARKKSALADVPEQEQTSSVGEASGGVRDIENVEGEIIYSMVGTDNVPQASSNGAAGSDGVFQVDDAPSSNESFYPPRGISMPMGPPHGWVNQQFPSLEVRPVGPRGIGEVVYENKKQLVVVATSWEKLRTKYREEKILDKHYREEGVILHEYKSKLKIEGLRYNIDYQWVKVSHLGNGMSGKCHLAKDFNTDFLFCVKEIHINNYEREEIELWTELEHPNIVKIYGAIRHGERLYILQELIEGGCLTEAINQQKNLGQRLSQQTALRYFQQLLQVLVYLRSKNILHEDLKADNILLHKENKSVSIKLADFGLARRCQAAVPKGTKPVGTQTQWSPEKAECVGYGFPAEVWASVCVLVHMLSGYPPWMRRFETLKALMVVIVEKSPPVEDIPRNITTMMRDLIERGFTVCAGERPTAAGMLLHAAFRMLKNVENRLESVAYSILDPLMVVQSPSQENEDLLRIINALDRKPKAPVPGPVQTPSINGAQIPCIMGTGASEGGATALTGKESDSSKPDTKPKLNRPLSSTEEMLEMFGQGFGSIPQTPTYRLPSTYPSITKSSIRPNPTRPERNTDPTSHYDSFYSDTDRPGLNTSYQPNLQLYQPDASIHSSSGNNSVHSSDTALMEKMLPDFHQLGVGNADLFANISTHKSDDESDDNDDTDDFHKNFDLNAARKQLGFSNDGAVSVSPLIPDVVRSPSTTESMPKDESEKSEGAADFPDVSEALETVVEVKPSLFDNTEISIEDDDLFASGGLEDSSVSAARNIETTQFLQRSPLTGTLQSSLSNSPLTRQEGASVQPDLSSASNYQTGSATTVMNYTRPYSASTASSSYYRPLGNNSMMRPSTPMLGRYGPISMPVHPNVTYQQRQGLHTNAPTQPMNPTVTRLPELNRASDDLHPVRGEIRNVNPITDRQTHSLQPQMMQGQPWTQRPAARSLFPVEHVDENNQATTAEQHAHEYSQPQMMEQHSNLMGVSTYGQLSLQSHDMLSSTSVLKPGRVNVKEDNNAINEMKKEQMIRASNIDPTVTMAIGGLPLVVTTTSDVASGSGHTNPGSPSHASRKPDLKLNTKMTVALPLSRSSTAPVFTLTQTTPNRLVPTPEFTRTTSLNQSATRHSDSSLSSMSPRSRQQTSTPRSQFDEQEEVLDQLKDVLSQHSDPDVFTPKYFPYDDDLPRNAEFDSVDMENPAASLAQYLDPLPNVAADITVQFQSPTNGAMLRMKFQPKHHDWSWKKIVEEELSRLTSFIERDFGLREFCLKWADGTPVDLDTSLGKTSVTVYIHAAGNTDLWVVNNGNIFFN